MIPLVPLKKNFYSGNIFKITEVKNNIMNPVIFHSVSVITDILLILFQDGFPFEALLVDFWSQ